MIEEIFSDDLRKVIIPILFFQFCSKDESCHFLFSLIFLQKKIILQKNLPCSFISAALNKVETILELVLKGASLIKNLRRSLSFIVE